VSETALQLPDARAALYVRALRAAVHALAPDADHVSALAADTHLHALDPAVSGPLLLPAVLDPGTGLPSSGWMDRVRAEREALHGTSPVTESRVARIATADPVLGARLSGRRNLMAWLGDRPLLPDLVVAGSVLRQERDHLLVQLTVDRRLDGAGWVRLRAEVHNPKIGGAAISRITRSGQVDVKPGLAELMARHTISPLPGVYGILTEVAGLQVRRMSRGCIGPFWFPGGPVPDHAPDWAHRGLVLHQSLAVLGAKVRQDGHVDPWLPPVLGERAPEGFGVYRSRRFAVSPAVEQAVRAWSHDRVGVAQVVVFGGR